MKKCPESIFNEPFDFQFKLIIQTEVCGSIKCFNRWVMYFPLKKKIKKIKNEDFASLAHLELGNTPLKTVNSLIFPGQRL